MCKKYIILTLLIAFTTILFTQCAKEEKTESSTESQLSTYDLKIINMVKGFKNKLNSGLKSSETMSIDSAIWYINTTTNATYGNPKNGDLLPGKIYCDSIFVNIPTNNGMLSIEQVDELYNKVIDSIRIVYYRVEDIDKQLCAVMFKPIEDGGNTTELKLDVVTYSTWGLQWWEQFGTTESYYFGWQKPDGTPVNPNAASKLMGKFGHHVFGNPYTTPYPLGGYCWINSFFYDVNATDYTYATGTFTN